MSPTVYCYAVYLTLSVLLTVWVARTLSRAGKGAVARQIVEIIASRPELQRQN